MKMPLALAAIILAVGGGLGWQGSQQLTAIRANRTQLIAEAASRGIVPNLANRRDAVRPVKQSPADRQATAKLIAAGFIAFGKEREAFEKAAGSHRDPVIQKQMGRRMAEFRERMMAMDPAQMNSIIAEVRASQDLSEETRQRLVAVSVLALANDHPQAVLGLFTDGSGFAKDDHSSGYVLSSSLARWAKDDPLAALAWVRQTAENFPDLITDDAKRGLLAGAAIQDPVLAFKLIAELGLKGTDNVIERIISAAQTPEQRSSTLAALRTHLATINDVSARDELAIGGLMVLTQEIVQDSFAAASQWLATAQLSPKELLGVAVALNYNTSRTGETGQWIEWLAANIPAEMSAEKMKFLMTSWTRNDCQAAGQWLAAAPDGLAKTTAIRTYAETVASYDPGVAAQWALTLPPGPDRDTTLLSIYQKWPLTDPAGAAVFAKEHAIK